MYDDFSKPRFETVYVCPLTQEVLPEDKWEDWLWEVAVFMYDRFPAREQKLTSVSDIINMLKQARWRWNRVKRCTNCHEIVLDNEAYGHHCSGGEISKIANDTYVKRRRD